MQNFTKDETAILPNPSAEAEAAVRTLLTYLGEDVTREGLIDTPRRVVKAWREMTSGYGEDPAQILARDFDGASYDEMIAVPNVAFHSTCEHHMLPFFGVAHVAYLPKPVGGSRVVGLSKIARLVGCFARRLQIQEQLTAQIADALEQHLDTAGVGVVVQARHMCMCARGVKQHKASMVTSAMRGAFRQGPARAEFLALVQMNGGQL
jgi:GTP cyclohydrolase I